MKSKLFGSNRPYDWMYTTYKEEENAGLIRPVQTSDTPPSEVGGAGAGARLGSPEAEAPRTGEGRDAGGGPKRNSLRSNTDTAVSENDERMSVWGKI